MMLVDSHCHIDCIDLQELGMGDVSDLLRLAQDSYVTKFLCVCIDLKAFPKMLALVEKYSEQVRASVGVHPNEVIKDMQNLTPRLMEYAQHPLIVAIGETGLDYYRTPSEFIDQQQQGFREHIRLAKQVNKPLIVHSRQAKEDTIRILQEEGAADCGGVMHCFSEDITMAKQAIELGFYISFSGVVTFKNAETLRDVVRAIPLTSMLVETDSPYLAPMPFRGKTNQPAYVRYVAEKIAEIKGVGFEEVAKVTTENCQKLFSWP